MKKKTRPSIYRVPQFQSDGFSLVEIAVVMIIIGIIISILATTLPSLIQTGKVSKAIALLERADNSLEGYVRINGRCPCPDTTGYPGSPGISDGVEDRNDGGTPEDSSDDTCDAYVGWLPWATLGLSSGQDNWQNNIGYGVHEDLIKTDSNTVCTDLATIALDINNASKLHTEKEAAGSTVITNMSYIIISGGARDMDGVNGFYDGRNGSSPEIKFETPVKMTSKTYDDIVKAHPLLVLNSDICSGGGSRTGDCEEEESVYCGNCGDGLDNDMKEGTDCDDPKCATYTECASGTCTIATDNTTPFEGNIDGTFDIDLSASTGCIGDLEWEWDDSAGNPKGGFTNFFIHPDKGEISGTLDQCPGTYTIRVKLTDSNSPEPVSTTKNFTIKIASNLSVLRTSGDKSTEITWSDPRQAETFEVIGEYIDKISWTLDTSDADGFSVVSTGDDTCTIKKNGTTTTGANKYNFKLTATDDACPSDNTAELSLVVDITEAALSPPLIDGIETEWRFDECDTWQAGLFNVVDALGDTAHYGNAVGGATAVYTGKFCRAASFDGNDDKIVSRVLTGDEKMVFNDQVSLACWFKSPGGGGQYPRLIEFSNASGASNRSTALCYDNDGSLRGWVTSETGIRGGSADYSAVRYADNKWHFAVYTYSMANGGRLYVDGQLKNTMTNNPTNDIYDAETFVIGGYFQNNTNGFKGLIDEAMVLRRELTADEITDLYNSNRSTCTGDCYQDALVAEYRMDEDSWSSFDVQDTSGLGNDGTANGSAAIIKTDSHMCYAGEFKNGDSYVSITGLDEISTTTGDQATVTFWMKWAGGNSEMPVGWTNYDLWFINPYFGFNTFGGDAYGITNAASVLANAWHHIGAVFTSRAPANNILTIDGEVQEMVLRRGSMNNRALGSNFRISGVTNSSAYKFNGLLDEVRVYKRGLAENEIKADMAITRDCGALAEVTLTTTTLPAGTVNTAYDFTITAIGGIPPPGGYGWAIISSGVGLSLEANTGRLYGTVDVCAGNYEITVSVTDGASEPVQKTFTLTVNNGTNTVSPASGKTFTCSQSDFSRNFTVSGKYLGSWTNWTITWLSVNPGGFEVVSTGTNTAKFRKTGTSSVGNGFQFKLTATDSTCPTNTVDSGFYVLNISGEGANTPYYSGIIGDYWLDELSGTTVADHSGNNNTGTITGAVTLGIRGKLWTAFSFDGTNEYVDIPDSALLDITGPITIAAWIKPTLSGNGNYKRILCKPFSDTWAEPYYLYNLWIHDNGAGCPLGFGISDGTTRYWEHHGSIANGVWQHVAGVYDGTNLIWYINGSNVGSRNIGSVTIETNSRNLRIGKAIPDATQFQGAIDEIKIFNKALSVSEINDLMNEASLVAYYPMEETSGNIMDWSGQGNHGTNTNATYSSFGKIGKGLAFDGSAYVNIGNSSVLYPSDITISSWINASTIDQQNGIITNINPARSPRFGINQQIGTDQKLASLNYDGASGDLYVSSTTTPVTGTWYHLVTTHDSATGKTTLYVNGIKESEQTRAISYNTSDSTYIGTFYTDGTLGFKGVIDEVRIYDRPLSAGEVLELYNKTNDES